MDEKSLFTQLFDLNPVNMSDTSMQSNNFEQNMDIHQLLSSQQPTISSPVPLDKTVNSIVNQVGGDIEDVVDNITTDVLDFLDDKNKPLVISMFQKYGYLYILLFLAIIISIYSIKNTFIQEIINRNNDNDYNFDDPNATHSSRYKYIIKITFIYILVIIVILFILYGLFTIILSIIYESNETIRIDAGNSFKTYVYNSYFKYNTKSGREIAGDYYISLIMIMLVGFVVYVLYFLFNKKYFTNISYTTYSKNDQDEWDNNMKYIILYGLMILMLMCFSFMIINIIYQKTSGLLICSCLTLSIFFIMFFTAQVFKNILHKDSLFILIWTISLLVLLIINPYIIILVLNLTTYILKMLRKNKD